MIYFENQYFQKIEFSKKEIEQFIVSAKRDLKIALDSDILEVVFKFSYDALIKIGIILIAGEGYKIRSQAGHHIKILEKLSQILNDEDVMVFGNKMRQDRNLGLYGGGHFISEKDSLEYIKFVKSVFEKAKEKMK